MIPRLQASWTPGQVYLGVGPDQNFTYLAALKPSLAFIVDIRRDNLRLQLLYKALPVDGASTFIRSCFNTCSNVPWSRSAQLLDPVAALLKDVASGRLFTYYDLLARSR